MHHKHQENTGPEAPDTADAGNVVCRVCGREIPVDSCSWEEDEPGPCCRECRAELESCGCGD